MIVPLLFFLPNIVARSAATLAFLLLSWLITALVPVTKVRASQPFGGRKHNLPQTELKKSEGGKNILMNQKYFQNAVNSGPENLA